MYGPLLVIIPLMYLSGSIWKQHVTCWSPTRRAPLDKVGGNYWGHAWLSSQGHFFFCCSDWTKQQGFSLAYILRTPWLPLPVSSCSLFISAALSVPLPLTLRACVHRVHVRVCMHASTCVHVHCTYARKKESVSCVAFDSVSNKRRTWFLLLLFFFPSLNWAMSSTVLLVITNLVGRYREGEKEREEWSHESWLTKQRQDWGKICLSRNKKEKKGRIVRRKEKGSDGAIKWYKVWQTWEEGRGDRGRQVEKGCCREGRRGMAGRGRG